MKIRIHALIPVTKVNGPGKRFGIWLQGCSQNCSNCYNPNAQDPTGGYDIEIDELYKKIISTKGIEGISISGGEPFEQAKEVLHLVTKVRNNTQLSILVFTNASPALLAKHKDLVNSVNYLVINHNQTKLEHNQQFIGIQCQSSKNMPQDIEIHINKDGGIIITGFPQNGEIKDISKIFDL